MGGLPMKMKTFYESDYKPIHFKKLKPNTIKQYEYVWRKYIQPEFGESSLRQLSTRMIERWHSSIPTPVAANRALSVLSSILKYAVKYNEIDEHPVKNISYNKENKRERYYTSDELKDIGKAISSLSQIEQDYIELCKLTGARPSEIVELNLNTVIAGVATLSDSKTGERKLYLSDLALLVLSKYEGIPFAGIDYISVWRKVLRRTNLDNAQLYDLRHTFASHGLKSGMDLHKIGKLLGHSSTNSTQRYAHLMDDDGIDSVNVISESLQ